MYFVIVFLLLISVEVGVKIKTTSTTAVTVSIIERRCCGANTNIILEERPHIISYFKNVYRIAVHGQKIDLILSLFGSKRHQGIFPSKSAFIFGVASFLMSGFDKNRRLRSINIVH